MRQTGANTQAGAYLTGKFKQADDRKDRLLNVINRLAQVSYDKGTRQSDDAVREKLAALIGEAEEQYRMIRVFGSGKGGDTAAFADILDFFNKRYLGRFLLRDLCVMARKEIAGHEKVDRDYGENHPDAEYARKINVYRKELDRELQEWENTLLHQFEPLLRGFLTEINDIVLFYRIADRIDRIITSDDVFSRSGPAYQDFKNSLAYFLELHVKLVRLPLTDAEMIDVLNRILQQTGFRSMILRARNINPVIYTEIMNEIISGGDLRQLVRDYSDTSRAALTAIRSAEKKEENALSAREMAKALEDLCYLDEIKDVERPAGIAAARGLARNEADRYLFHSPGTFDISLKFVSEYMRDSMIFVIDWLSKDMQKTPGAGGLLRPVAECLPSIRTFISYYRLALDVASDTSNQAGSGSKEKHFISRQIARGLIQTINDNCNSIKLSLVDVSYNLLNSTMDRSGVLSKKLGIIKESVNDSCVKISKGIAEIGRV